MIDEQYLQDAFGGDDEFLQEVLEIYVSSSELLKVDLIDALAIEDQPRVRSIAHTFKGSSRSIGANEFATRCEELEKAIEWPDILAAAQTMLRNLPPLLLACRKRIAEIPAP